MDFEEFIKEWRSAAPFIEARTSGSTGSPKIIHLDKDFVRRSGLRTNRYFSIGEGSRLHSCVAADYIGGKMMAVRADIAGGRLTWENPSNRPLTDLAHDEKIDLLAVVPSQMIHIIENLPRMPQLGAVIIGGSVISPMLYKQICESGLNAYETYGMTETASHVALRKIEENSVYFETLEGITVSLDDRECLVIKFDSGERFVTNDLADVESGTLFRIKGRYDHIIITGGKKVNPQEVEDKLSPYISSPFVITSVADYKWGRAVVLKIEKTLFEKIDEDELRKVMKRVLAPHEMPKQIVYVDHLPRTRSGKIIKK